MNPRNRTLTAVISGAVVLATGAYAIGAQRDDGSASAADNARVAQGYGAGGGPGLRRHRELDLSAAAKKLGVSEAKLRSALESMRGDGPDHRRDGDGPDALAKSLGVSQAKLRK